MKRIVRRIFRSFGVYFEDEYGLLLDIHAAVHMFNCDRSNSSFCILMHRQIKYNAFKKENR